MGVTAGMGAHSALGGRRRVRIFHDSRRRAPAWPNARLNQEESTCCTKLAGDILLTRAQAIAHGVGPHDNFAQGLALSLRERWPAMYKDFRHYCQVHNPKPGDAVGVDGRRRQAHRQPVHPGSAQAQGRPPGPLVPDPPRPLPESALEAFAAGRNSCRALRCRGWQPAWAGWTGTWCDRRLQSHLGKLDMPVMVYTTYHADQAADEPL